MYINVTYCFIYLLKPNLYFLGIKLNFRNYCIHAYKCKRVFTEKYLILMLYFLLFISWIEFVYFWQIKLNCPYFLLLGINVIIFIGGWLLNTTYWYWNISFFLWIEFATFWEWNLNLFTTIKYWCNFIDYCVFIEHYWVLMLYYLLLSPEYLLKSIEYLGNISLYLFSKNVFVYLRVKT